MARVFTLSFALTLRRGSSPRVRFDCVIVRGYVTVTQNHLSGESIVDGSRFLESIKPASPSTPSDSIDVGDHPGRIEAARSAMAKVEIGEETDGSGRVVKYARQAVRWGLNVDEAVELIGQVLAEDPTPRDWTDDEIARRWEQAHRDVQFGEAWVARDFTNYQSVGRTTIGIPLRTLLADFNSRFGDWPKRCRGILFDVEGKRLIRCSQFFAWLPRAEPR